eukprot:TRINITY_DN3181_c0_g1_i5.p1 TRINITY_DN3181_c0_g1~~TRINITY_DN3181_c0_g1_i5.p1  ORF type:complete len:164 (-),score=21.59 TRINITY_DN3181_c0_g1_i5:163-654(-)
MFFGNSKPEVSYGVPVSFTISLEQTYSCVFTPYQKRSLLIITCIDKIGSMFLSKKTNSSFSDTVCILGGRDSDSKESSLCSTISEKTHCPQIVIGLGLQKTLSIGDVKGLLPPICDIINGVIPKVREHQDPFIPNRDEVDNYEAPVKFKMVSMEYMEAELAKS